MNICFRGERMESGVSGAVTVISLYDSLSSPSAMARIKMSGKSVRKWEINGPGILRVGAKTMPTGYN